jgi:methanogenic corrinoid protein MtbC1
LCDNVLMRGEADPSLGLSIGDTERRTGLPKDTLRVWERRYGFPVPVRSARATRVYPPDQVAKLALLKVLVDQGHRPAGLVARPVEELRALARADSSAPVHAGDLSGVEAFLAGGGVDELRRWLSRAVSRRGLESFVLDIVAPATRIVGDAWARDGLAIYTEHLFTEQVSRVLRSSIEDLPRPSEEDGPRVVLATLPGEPHTLGLLMAEAILALEGADCLSLGAETPPREIAAAAAAHRSQVVALSLSGITDAERARQDLQRLSGALPEGVQVWIGGGGAGAIEDRRYPRILDLHDVPAVVQDWRRRSARG